MPQIFPVNPLKYIPLSLVCIFVAQGSLAQKNEDKVHLFIHYLQTHKFDSAYRYFNEEVRENFSRRNLALTWNEFERQGEGLQRIGKPRLNFSSGNEAWFTELVFKKTTLDLVLVFDSLSQVAGFWVRLPEPACDYKDPGYATGNFSYREIHLTVVCGQYKLPAILTLPASTKNVPVVVLVHGSGPNDKDETTGNYKIFRDLALGFAAKGVATLRYEKRSRVYGTKMTPDPENFTVNDEVIDDALAALELAKKQPGIDSSRVFLLGHSLGAMLAPRIAAQSKNLKGVMMLGANARPLQKLIVDQYEYLLAIDTSTTIKEKAEIISEVKQQAEQLLDTTMIKNMPAEDLLLKLPATYWIDLMNYNQVKTARAITTPLLIVQGGRDYQVTTKEFDLWKQGLKKRKRTSFLLFPNLNHLMISGTGQSTPEEYTQTTGNVPEVFIIELFKWMSAVK